MHSYMWQLTSQKVTTKDL